MLGVVPKRLGRFFHDAPSAVSLLVLVFTFTSFSILLGGRFLSPLAISLLLQQVQIVGLVALAQAIVVITAGIDLSVGAIMVLSAVVMGHLAVTYEFSGLFAIVGGMLVGGGIGALNGFFVGRLNLPPFIVTLGTWQIFLAANFIFSSSQTIQSSDLAGASTHLTLLGEPVVAAFGFITWGVLLMLIMYALVAAMMAMSRWGRHVYAVGDDAEAASLSGIRTERVLMSVYMLAGIIAAIAGWALIGRLGTVSPTAGQTANIESITAVVIGGISLFGGRGGVLGALFGALLVGTLTLGLRLMGFDVQWTFLLIGLLIIAAVLLDRSVRKAVGL